MKLLPKQLLSPYRKSGSILIISIWILVFFSILSVGLFRIVSAQIRIVKRIEEIALSQYLAKAAYTYATLERKKPKTAYDTLYQLRQKREKELGRGKFIATYIDEESKININNASAEILSGLPGLNPDLAKAINESTLKPFHLKEGLLLVEGMNEEIFAQCKDFITTYSEGKVNINTASSEVLRALGLNEGTISTINDFRIGSDNKELTEDDGIFENSSEITAKLEASGGISESDAAVFNQLISQGLITVESKNLSLNVDAQILDRPVMKYVIVMDKEKIKEWREY